MKEFLKRWLFKDDVEHMEWYLARRKDELERNHQDHRNYLEIKYAMIVRENKRLHKVFGDFVSLSPGNPFIIESREAVLPETSGGNS